LGRPGGLIFYLSAAALVSCLLLGGGTIAGLLSDAALELLAIPVLLVALARLAEDRPSLTRLRWALLFCTGLILVPALQLVPLPPRLWTQLPGRSGEAAAFDLLQTSLPWMPISVSPAATRLSAISLVPPVAIFLAVIALGARERRRLSLLVLGVGSVSAFFGLAQVAQGPSSPLRFYEVTNETEAVGFFANRNHFAAFLYCLIVLTAAWITEAANTSSSGNRRFGNTRIMALVGGFTLLVILLAAEAMARSRAGLGLTIAALLGGMALALADRRTTSGITPIRLFMAAAALAAMFVVQFTLYRLLERFYDPLRDSRIVFAQVTAAAAKSLMPFGSGVGTFVPVYAAFEKPQDALLDTYVNRAHNDFLELWLEAGVAAMVLMALFFVWLIRRSLKVWRRNPDVPQLDLSLQRSGTIIIGLIVAHSALDYPLRTGAMMAVLALACALLTDAPPDFEPGAGSKRTASIARPAAQRWQAARDRLPELSEPPSAPHRGASPRWGDGMEWPDEWRSASNHTRPRPGSKTKGPRE
jgi:O-antigen ligase